MEKYIFYEGLDSIGYDIKCVGSIGVDELIKICENDEKCIGINTYGYMKYKIVEENKLIKINYNMENGGIYINKERYKKSKNNHYIEYEDYIFYRNKDKIGNDIITYNDKKIEEIKELSDRNVECKGFNTKGKLKYKIEEMIEMSAGNYNDGIYVKKEMIRVKMICNWCTSEELCNEWNNMSKGDYKWNNIKIVWTDDADYFVIINKPLNQNEYYNPIRTIIFQMEPWCGDENQKWGVKTWGEWKKPDKNVFLQVRTHENYINNGFWQLKTTYNEFKTIKINKNKLISTICSSKYFDPGHIKRIDFLKYIESKNDDIVNIDIYNHDNKHNFKNYKGPHPKNNKDYGIIKYKYYFMAENNIEKNFITEKLWEPIICETLCFYWGCPNVDEYIDPRAFILLDLNDYEKSFNIIKTAIINDEWGKRLEYIRREKQKILEYYQFFPTLERILKFDFQLTNKSTDDEIIYHKYFKDIINSKINNICFIHSCNINSCLSIINKITNLINETKLLDKLDIIYIINLGEPINITHYKIKIINFSNNINLYECITLNLIHLFSHFNHNTNILYLHTKGVSYNYLHNNLNDWINLMLYFLIEKHDECLKLLNNYDTIGCNLLSLPHKHYSGNFWWSNSNYIKNLTQVKYQKHEAEWWLLSNNNVNPYCIYSSNINHYQEPYPRNLYVK